MILKYFLIILLVGALFSCGKHTSMLPHDYMQHVQNPENGLHQSKDTGPFLLDVQYQPLEYVCLIQNGSSEISKKQLTALESEFEGLMYFKISISSKEGVDPLMAGLSDSTQLENRILYLSGEASKDFYLLQQTDTVKCVLHHFERNYGLAPRLDIMLAFEKLKTSSTTQVEQLRFCYSDRLFDLGDHQFVFNTSVFESVPSVQTTDL